MTILLRWLVDYAWVFCVACALGAFVYLLRAVAAHRERRLALFTLERETATSRIVRAWLMVLVLVALGAVIFVSAMFILPDLPIYTGASSLTPTPAAGLEPVTPAAMTPTSSPTPGLVVPTLASTRAAVPTPPPPELAETPSSTPTEVPASAAAGEVNVRFGDFAILTGYSVASTRITPAQPLVLTLNWRALDARSPINYMVFTHLRREDGSIVAQHDGLPAGGTPPMVEWAPGQGIVDTHPLSFVPDAAGYAGPASIAVGLYNPDALGERVLTDAGADLVVLPVAIAVVSQ